MLERLVDQFSLYAVIRMAMTGEGLFTSKGTLLHVVRRAGISSYFVFRMALGTGARDIMAHVAFLFLISEFVVHLALWCFAVGFAVGSSAFVYMIMALFFDGENGGVFAIFILLSSLMHARIFTTVFYTMYVLTRLKPKSNSFRPQSQRPLCVLFDGQRRQQYGCVGRVQRQCRNGIYFPRPEAKD